MNSQPPPRRGLASALKERLIQEGLRRRLRECSPESEDIQDSELARAHAPGQLQPSMALEASSAPPASPEPPVNAQLSKWCSFDQHPGYRQLQILREGAAKVGIDNPYFRMNEGSAGARIRSGERTLINYSSYNYLALAGHPEVNAAAKAAIDEYGTSVSASRLVSGERPIHRELECALADLHGVQDCVVFVSGHATNVSTIAALFGPRDLVAHDALIHNSVLLGIQASGAHRLPFAHNDPQALDRLLSQRRAQFERVLVVVEGLYSMDGDLPDLPSLIAIKRRHHALLMVDEAHSLGVLGGSGAGIKEHFGVDGTQVDIWMGTLSKALASCGGYIAGEAALIEHLKCSAPGFVYSVGMPASAAAAALAALRVMRAEPSRVQRLRQRGNQFLQLARERGIDTGFSAGLSVIPAITQSSLKAARLAARLGHRGINVQPILYPAVPEHAARLRFFVCCEHSEEQILETVETLAEEWRRL